MSNADKLQSIYFCERIVAEANNDIDRLQADKRLIEEKLKVRIEERDEAALTLSAVKEAIHSIKNPIHRELLERYYLKGSDMGAGGGENALFNHSYIPITERGY